jgi:uncharacterized protein (TIGR02996 family)
LSAAIQHEPGQIVTDRETLFAAILSDPTDNTARLVLADMLRELDDPAERALGRFIWAGVTASHFSDDEVIDDPLYYAAQKEIAAVASMGLPAQWLADLGLGVRPLSRGDWLWDNTLDRVTVRIGDTSGGFTRGMLSNLTVPLAQWCTTAPAALELWPLAAGTISDIAGLTFTIGPTTEGWRLAAQLRLRRRRVPMTAGGVVPAAVSPQPFLIDEAGDVEVESLFPDRAALIAGVHTRSLELVTELRETVGDRWQGPTRRRH